MQMIVSLLLKGKAEGGIVILLFLSTLIFALEAVLTFSVISFCNTIKFIEIEFDGLGIKSTAPLEIACSVFIVLSSDILETITTGVGNFSKICSKVVSPSITGISISSVMTSGFNLGIFSKHTWPF